MFCLDTNAVIAVIATKPPSVNARLRIEVRRGTPIIVPVIVIYELRYGIAKSTRRSFNQHMLDAFLTLPVEVPAFDQSDAVEAADIRAALERKGTPISAYDILIAAQARRRSATLVTANGREFRRVSGLAIEDWAAE